jgi:hypothetical protein
VNKKAGIKFPNTPIIISPFQYFFRSIFLNLKSSGLKQIKAMLILIAPTSLLLYASNPRFIRIKELPQISERRMSKNQALLLFCTAQSYSFPAFHKCW